MFNKIKTGATSLKNHVKRQKYAYAASIVAIAAIKLQQQNLKAFYAFLEEKGIDPLEFTCPEALTEAVQNAS